MIKVILTNRQNKTLIGFRHVFPPYLRVSNLRILGDSLNIHFVENRLVLDRPHTAAFDWITTWSTLPK
jgi:hypothetical protein